MSHKTDFHNVAKTNFCNVSKTSLLICWKFRTSTLGASSVPPNIYCNIITAHIHNFTDLNLLLSNQEGMQYGVFLKKFLLAVKKGRNMKCLLVIEINN